MGCLQGQIISFSISLSFTFLFAREAEGERAVRKNLLLLPHPRHLLLCRMSEVREMVVPGKEREKVRVKEMIRNNPALPPVSSSSTFPPLMNQPRSGCLVLALIGCLMLLGLSVAFNFVLAAGSSVTPEREPKFEKTTLATAAKGTVDEICVIYLKGIISGHGTRAVWRPDAVVAPR